MSLTTDREPVEVRMFYNGTPKPGWVPVRRYVINRKHDGWLTFLDSEGEERMAAPGNWRKVNRES